MSFDTESHSYVIQEQIIRTKYFIIYKAKNMLTGNLCMIKAIEPKWLSHTDIQSELRNQALISSELKHPNICSVNTIFEEDNSIYVVWEYVDGQSLSKLMAEQSISVNQTIEYCIQILNALSYAHTLGIIHKQLNPDSILVTPDGKVKIIGFGKSNSAWMKVEKENTLLHPVYYISPEIYHGEAASPPSDLYSLGVMIYAMLTRRLPWSIDYKQPFLLQKQQSLLKPVLNPDLFGDRVPQWLYSVINHTLMVDTRLRLSSCSEMISALENEVQYPYSPVMELAEELSTVTAPKTEDRCEASSVESEVLSSAEIDSLNSNTELIEEIPVAVKSVQIDTSATEGVSTSVQMPEDAEIENAEPLVAEKSETVPIAHPEIAKVIHSQGKEKQVFGALDDGLIQQQAITSQPQNRVETALVPEPPKEPVLNTIDTSIIAETPHPITSSPILEEPTVQNMPRGQKLYSPPKPLQNAAPDEAEEISHIKKLFTWMIYLSMAVVLFIVIKYFIIHKAPEFKSIATKTEDVATKTPALETNLTINMISIPGDSTVIGSMDSDADPDEFPICQVVIRPFLMSKTEITQKQWLMANPINPSRFVDDNNPVENVSFYDVIDFCNGKSILDGLNPCYDYLGDLVTCDFNANGYRLPTEAEWEYAAKARNKAEYFTFSGSDNPDEVGWYLSNSKASTQEVAKLKPNEIGIFDLSGNVSEWVWDWYGRYSYKMHDVFSGPANGSDKVIRGGNWYSDAHEMRVTNRQYVKPFTKANYIGFRVVRSNY